MELNILIVDDNREAAELFQELLDMQGYDVRCAYNAQQALAMAAEAPAHVYLLDLTLPDMHGTELGRKLQQMAGAETPLLIAVTGLSADGGNADDMAIFAHFMQKPVDFEKLERILADVAHNR
ncbi:response regulator [Xylophilus ampelinus]|uniref:Response regulator receiver domain-containing protein n=1 Tax=Xylophilus ampelinus TaxID=54067 RepID=A0A318SL48_9BURK|nr:response regulator [Xylophilus ampelinus]MCS4509451.1 response regulator [Xylophilus ampelinus]PYE79180.1 response regulator receiver domain-containing protein [Xylophilus ampelinus]